MGTREWLRRALATTARKTDETSLSSADSAALSDPTNVPVERPGEAAESGKERAETSQVYSEDTRGPGLLYPADVSSSPHLSEALSWITVESVQPSDPLYGTCDHAAWIDDAALGVLPERVIMSIAPAIAAHPLVEAAVHNERDVVYVRAPALLDADIGLLTAAVLADRFPTTTPAPPIAAAREGDQRRPLLIAGSLGVIALLIAAFAAGGWWSSRSTDTQSATPIAFAPSSETAVTQPAADEPSSPATATAETVPPADETSDTTRPPATTAPPPIDAQAVVAAATQALTGAGYQGVTARFDSGNLVLEGVMPSGELGTGYFAYIDGITSAVSSVDGVQAVSPRLFLRGDDAALRAQLTVISETQPIEFPFASAELTDESRAALQSVAAAILANPGLRVLVAGHTDASGSPEANAALGASRAGAVIRELVALGVPITRLQPVAYGELFPEEGGSDAENRRVEFEVAP